MKKQLLSIFAALTVSAVLAQPSTDWITNQNSIFPSTAVNTGVKFMDAVDANVVWVIGRDYGAISRNYNWYSRSTNGGASFAGGNIFSDTNTYVISNMEGIDANTAWVCSYMKAAGQGGAIHRTTNGGTTWPNMTASGMYTSTTCFGNWVTFLTPSVGIANGDPVNGEFEIWRTTDGGLSWNQIPGSNIPNPLPGEFAIVNLYAKVGTSNLWYGTNGYRMFRSVDAGITWSVSTVGSVSTNTIIDIAFSSPLNGICYMIDSGFNQLLWNTNDGGVTWTQISPLPANLGLADIGGIPGTGKLVSYGSGNGNEIISYSGDNGITWTDWGSIGIPYITGDFVDGTTAWAGSLDFTVTTGYTDVWKYSGPTITGTVAPAAAFSIPNALCLSGPSATIIPANTSIGSPALTYSWSVAPSGATLSSPTASAPLITFSTGNTYTVTLLATNSGGSSSTSWVITVAACIAPAANFTIPSAGCTNYSFTAANTSSGSPTPGYLWSISPATGVTISPSVNGLSPSIKASTAGVYSITLYATNASGTTQTTQTINIASCGPLANFSIPSLTNSTLYFCNAKTFTTVNSTTNPPGASGAITYTWSVLPSTGVSVFPNYFLSYLYVTLSNTTITQYVVTLKAKNASTLTTTSQTVTVDFCLDGVGISENSYLADNLLVYPNPAHEQLNVILPSSSDVYKIKVINVLGAVVYDEKTLKNSKENISINLSNKPKGIYFLMVESANDKVTKKIVVE